MTAAQRSIPTAAILMLLVTAGLVFAAWKWGSSGGTESSPAPAPEAQDSQWSRPVIVKTVLQVPNYTYLEVAPKPGESVWIAAPTLAAKVGDRVIVQDVDEQRDFFSPTLDRTFKEILFARVAAIVDDQDQIIATSQEHAALAAAHARHAASETAPLWDPTLPALEKPAGGLSIEEVYASAVQLAGKPVKIRGTIVKVTPAVLGKNWYHLQDGSGDATTGDITVTTQDKAELGETVIVSGTLHVNRDVGSGYFFPVIIEDATLQR